MWSDCYECVGTVCGKKTSKFYEFIQKQPGLLQKIVSQEKYDFKNTQVNVEKSPGAMSIDTIPED